MNCFKRLLFYRLHCSSPSISAITIPVLLSFFPSFFFVSYCSQQSDGQARVNAFSFFVCLFLLVDCVHYSISGLLLVSSFAAPSFLSFHAFCFVFHQPLSSCNQPLRVFSEIKHLLLVNPAVNSHRSFVKSSFLHAQIWFPPHVVNLHLLNGSTPLPLFEHSLDDGRLLLSST